MVPMSVRDVMNSFVLEGYEIPVGSRVYIAQTASHYVGDIFPDPCSFDIDRYLPPSDQHRGPGRPVPLTVRRRPNTVGSDIGPSRPGLDAPGPGSR